MTKKINMITFFLLRFHQIYKKNRLGKSFLLFCSLMSFLIIFFASCSKVDSLAFTEAKEVLPDLNCRSAILMDYHSGRILFEKNADEVIPPASMTKLFLLYLALKGEKEGKWDLKRQEEVSEEADYRRQPPSSSLMFLQEGDLTSFEELLWGLMVPSGNDAAVAVAKRMYKTVDQCVIEMNRTAKALNLKQTSFVEPSGFSPKNQTTAKDFVHFCSSLWAEFPEAVEKFCTAAHFFYPKPENKPSWRAVAQAGIFQLNHNELVGRKKGVKGLKTGYIDQSGANIALIYTKEESTFIAVLMGGVGKDSMQRSLYRTIDSTTLLTWAENNFQTVPIKGPSSLFITERKRNRQIPVFSEESGQETFSSVELSQLHYQYKLKKSIKELPPDSYLPVVVGKWKLLMGKETIASGNLFVKSEN